MLDRLRKALIVMLENQVAESPPSAGSATEATEGENSPPIPTEADVVDVARCKQAYVFRRLWMAGGESHPVHTLQDDEGGEWLAAEWTWGPTERN